MRRLILWLLAGWFGLPVAATADCQLLLLVDNSKSVQQYDFLTSKLRRLASRLVNSEPPVSVLVIPIATEQTEVRFFDSPQAIRDDFYRALTFDSLYTWITPAVEAALEHPAIALGPETTVVVLSDFKPDHHNEPDYDSEDFTDLLTSLDLFTSDSWRGAKVHPIFLGNPSAPPPGFAQELLQRDLEGLRATLARYAKDDTECWSDYKGGCSAVQKYLTLMTATAIAEHHGTTLRHLTEVMEVNGRISEILFQNRCMPEVVSDTVAVGWFAEQLPVPASELLGQTLTTDRIVAHHYPRTINYSQLDAEHPEGFERVRFILHLEPGLSAYEPKATLRSVKPGQSHVVAGPQILQATNARSLVNRTQHFLNIELRAAIEREIPPPRVLLNARIVYGEDKKFAPGYSLRFEIGDSGYQAFSEQLSDRSGLIDILVTESTEGQLVIFDKDARQRDSAPLDNQPFDSTDLVSDEIETLKLPTYRLTLLPGKHPDAGPEYRYRIYKPGTRDYYATGRVSTSSKSEILPPGHFIVNGLPTNWGEYLQWDYEIELKTDNTVDPGAFDPKQQRFREFQVDNFSKIFRSDTVSTSDTSLATLFQGFPENAASYRILRIGTEPQWNFSPYVFHVLSRLIAAEWSNGSSREKLKRALDLYKTFGFNHPLWLMRRGPSDPTLSNPFNNPESEAERDRRLQNYLFALWRAVVFAPEEFSPFTDLLDKLEYEGHLETIREDFDLFLEEYLHWSHFEPVENGNNVEIRQLLREKGMIP